MDPLFPFRTDAIEEEDQNHRPHRITVGGQDIFQRQVGVVNEQFVFPQILPDQTEAQRCDDEHDQSLSPLDIWVDHHSKPRAKQEKQR